jgi:hypothetical protein
MLDQACSLVGLTTQAHKDGSANVGMPGHAGERTLKHGVGWAAYAHGASTAKGEGNHAIHIGE